MRQSKRGKLIVVDGIDGVGKATQVELLVGRLRRDGIRAQTIDFPRYYDNFFGKLIGECLAGKHGDFLAVNPRIASVLYAADRFESKRQIEGWLARGYAVIADRYVSANQIHQSGKIDDPRARADFLRWLDKMEYEVFSLPRPDLIVYLDLPYEVSQELLNKKRNAHLEYKKRYAEGAGDSAEADSAYLDNSRRSALKLVAEDNQWTKIDCAPEGVLLTKGEIHLKIMETVRPLLATSRR